MRYPLECRQRLAESFALANVFPGLVQSRAGNRQYLQADEGARKIEALHDLHEAASFASQPVAGGHSHILETNRTASDGTLTWAVRSEEHTSELQSLMRISYAVF